MNEEPRDPTPDTSPPAEAPEIERGSLDEYKSLDAVLQSVEAVGVLSGGLGTLAIGASKLKETFGGGDPSTEPASPPAGDAPSSDEPK